MHRRFFAVTIVCSCLLAQSAWADWVIVQEVAHTGMPASNRITLKIKGDKAKIEAGQGATITDNASGSQITLMPATKTYHVVTASNMREMQELIEEKFPAPHVGSKQESRLEPTGRKQTINGFNTEEFIWKWSEGKSVYWITKGIPNYSAAFKQMDKSFAAVAGLSRAPLPRANQFQGYPVRVESEFTLPKYTAEQARYLNKDINEKQTVRSVTTLVSITETKLDESEFSIPADYKQAGAQAPRNISAGDRRKSVEGMKRALEEMGKSGVPENNLKQFEQMIKNAETQQH